MTKRLPGLLVASLLVAGCPNLVESDGAFTAELAGDAVTLRNGADEPVWYAVIGNESLILFAPCVRADCPRVEAGESETVPMDEVPAGASSDTIRVHWWTTRGSGESGPVRTIRLIR